MENKLLKLLIVGVSLFPFTTPVEAQTSGYSFVRYPNSQHIFAVKGNNKQHRPQNLRERAREALKNANPAEQWAIKIYGPAAAQVIDIARKQANEETIKRYGADIDDTRNNAFKHCYWSGLATSVIGPLHTKAFTDAHEAYVGEPGNWRRQGPSRHKAMDLYNNQVGRSIGQYISFHRWRGWGREEIANVCQRFEQQDRLRVLIR
ncbi:hypothetical protein NDA01_23600 [Trichocoleus desertorum AS-A10]|uniref:DUF6973 domain-containing protein n=1 Tax=Trichocoleus desertorum TaxID=1481672 RepID=UPI003297C8B5